MWNTCKGAPHGRLFTFDPSSLGRLAEVEPIRVVNGGRASLTLDLLSWQVFAGGNNALAGGGGLVGLVLVILLVLFLLGHIQV